MAGFSFYFPLGRMPFRLSLRARSTAWIHSAKHTTASPSVRDQITNEARTFPPGLSYILCPRSTVPVGAIHGRPTFLRIRTPQHPLSPSDLLQLLYHPRQVGQG